MTRSPCAGWFGGTQSLQDPFFRARCGGFAAVPGAKKERFRGQQAAPNPHRVTHANHTNCSYDSNGMIGACRNALRKSTREPAMQLESAEALLKRYAKRNFWLNVLDGVAFVFGISMVSRYTVLPLFVTRLSSERWLQG